MIGSIFHCIHLSGLFLFLVIFLNIIYVIMEIVGIFYNLVLKRIGSKFLENSL